MFKRRAWRHESSDDSSDESESSQNSSEEEVDEGESDVSRGSKQPSGEDEDESDDLDSDVDLYAALGEQTRPQQEDGVSAQDVIKVWTSDDPEAAQFKGIPLRCNMCKALLLNRETYLRHVASKKHLSKLKLWPPGALDPIQLAKALGSTEEEETHAERLERIMRLAQQKQALEQQQLQQKQQQEEKRLQQRQQKLQQKAQRKQKQTRAGAVEAASDSADEEDPQPSTSGKAMAKHKAAKNSDNGSSIAAASAEPDVQVGGSAAVQAAAAGKQAVGSRKRPGKRQRAALKAAGLDPSTGRKFKPKKKKKTAETVQDGSS